MGGSGKWLLRAGVKSLQNGQETIASMRGIAH
jgi:hypothetical protein